MTIVAIEERPIAIAAARISLIFTRIILVEAGPTILPAFPEKLRDAARASLRDLQGPVDGLADQEQVRRSVHARMSSHEIPSNLLPFPSRPSAAEAIDLLVDRVGHERRNATAEVRRSVAGGYGPLYQCAYLIGGMQFRALRKELVDGGLMIRLSW